MYALLDRRCPPPDSSSSSTLVLQHALSLHAGRVEFDEKKFARVKVHVRVQSGSFGTL